MKETRLYYVDWLRVFVIVSLVPYHAALTYTGLGDIYIKKIITDFRVIPYILVTMPLDSFFMTLLFFLAGISSYYALKYRKKEEYIKDRLKKLLVPLVLGTIFLCPLQAYSKALYYGFKGNYFQFIPKFLSVKIVDYLGYAHLWFILYLLIFSLICHPLFSKWIKDESQFIKLKNFVSKKNNIYIPIIWVIIVEILLRPLFPGMQILIMDWANDIVYISVYIFGFIYASDCRIQDRLDKMLSKSAILVLICLIALFVIYCYWLLYNGDSIIVTVIWAFLKGVYECFMIIMLLGLGRKCLNKESKVLRYLSKASFTYYIFHLLPVSYFTYIFVSSSLNEYNKYLVTVLLSYITIAIFYELIKRMKIIVRRISSDIPKGLSDYFN
ncbi:acyltransferase family protein [Abyssisolibacter fermentans]|uniref:acyltransferase family protein n=1 Tax=Abyssisolibacter fermentans TaxID=1766203 RepID=UPI000836122E|nr:acyltransferase family protein [Abyssisolibacter fermentans]